MSVNIGIPQAILLALYIMSFAIKYEVWDIEDGRGIYVHFKVCPYDTEPEIMAFPYDLRRKKVTSWNELGVWYEDATGGKAVRELGYEPIEENYR